MRDHQGCTVLLALLSLLGGSCRNLQGRGTEGALTIPGEPLKHGDTPLQIPADASFASNADGGELLLGFEAEPGEKSRSVRNDYYTTGRTVMQGTAPGRPTKFRRDYWFFVDVANRRLMVARYGNPAQTAHPLGLSSLAAGAEREDVSSQSVTEFHSSWSLGKFYAHENGQMIVEVTAGNPPARRLYRARIGDIEKCLDGECK